MTLKKSSVSMMSSASDLLLVPRAAAQVNTIRNPVLIPEQQEALVTFGDQLGKTHTTTGDEVWNRALEYAKDRDDENLNPKLMIGIATNTAVRDDIWLTIGTAPAAGNMTSDMKVDEQSTKKTIKDNIPTLTLKQIHAKNMIQNVDTVQDPPKNLGTIKSANAAHSEGETIVGYNGSSTQSSDSIDLSKFRRVGSNIYKGLKQVKVSKSGMFKFTQKGKTHYVNMSDARIKE